MPFAQQNAIPNARLALLLRCQVHLDDEHLTPWSDMAMLYRYNITHCTTF